MGRCIETEHVGPCTDSIHVWHRKLVLQVGWIPKHACCHDGEFFAVCPWGSGPCFFLSLMLYCSEVAKGRPSQERQLAGKWMTTRPLDIVWWNWGALFLGAYIPTSMHKLASSVGMSDINACMACIPLAAHIDVWGSKSLVELQANNGWEVILFLSFLYIFNRMLALFLRLFCSHHHVLYFLLSLAWTWFAIISLKYYVQEQ